MLYKDRDWLNNIITLKSAHQNCVKKIKNNIKLDSYLNWSDIENFVKNEVCLSVLENKKINSIVNNKTYQIVESKIEQFNNFVHSQKNKLFKKCQQKESQFKKEICIRNKWESNANKAFKQWVKIDQNKYFIDYKELFITRTKDKLKTNRSIASE